MGHAPRMWTVFVASVDASEVPAEPVSEKGASATSSLRQRRKSLIVKPLARPSRHVQCTLAPGNERCNDVHRLGSYVGVITNKMRQCTDREVHILGAAAVCRQTPPAVKIELRVLEDLRPVDVVRDRRSLRKVTRPRESRVALQSWVLKVRVPERDQTLTRKYLSPHGLPDPATTGYTGYTRVLPGNTRYARVVLGTTGYTRELQSKVIWAMPGPSVPGTALK
jgi:hypothetical protein